MDLNKQMQSKLSVLLLRGKNISETSDINKMFVHIEQVLTEKDGVDLKVRQGLTEPSIKSADFIILCGYDSSNLSELFKCISTLESLDGDSGPTIFLYEEPGVAIYEKLNYILTEMMDLGRINFKVFKKVVDTITYRDIIGYIDVSLKKLELSAIT